MSPTAQKGGVVVRVLKREKSTSPNPFKQFHLSPLQIARIV